MIPGKVDYSKLAQQHKPADPSIQIRRLHAEGLKPRDIASHLCVHIDIVLRALQTGRNQGSRDSDPGAAGKERKGAA